MRIWSDSTLALGGGTAGTHALYEHIAGRLKEFEIQSWHVEKGAALRDATYRMCVTIVKAHGGSSRDCAEYFSLTPAARAEKIDNFITQMARTATSPSKPLT